MTPSKKKSKSLRLVIDASVACREALIAVRRICHHFAISRDIREEWNRKRSGFARSWRATMNAMKKLDAVEAPGSAHEHLSDPGFTEEQRQAVEKDWRLVSAALSPGGDAIILSRDERLLTLLLRLAASRPELNDIVWLDPSIREEREALEHLHISRRRSRFTLRERAKSR